MVKVLPSGGDPCSLEAIPVDGQPEAGGVRDGKSAVHPAGGATKIVSPTETIPRCHSTIQPFIRPAMLCMLKSGQPLPLAIGRLSICAR